MLEIPDQLAQDPRLIRISDTAVGLFHDRVGENLRPRQVVQRDLAKLALVDARRVLPSGSEDLVGDRDDGVEASAFAMSRYVSSCGT